MVRQILIESPSDLNKQDVVDYPIVYAIRHERSEMVEVLLEFHPNFTVESVVSSEGTPLYCACGNGQLDIARLLVQAGAKPQASDSFGRSPLHAAALNGQSNVVKWLIEVGVPVDASDKRGDTPLHMAARNGMYGAVALLLDNGAEIERRNKDGLTPMHWAVFSGSLKLVKELQRRGSNINAKTRYGDTPRRMAQKLEENTIADYLKQQGGKR
jgi:ankyrin repeat protein